MSTRNIPRGDEEVEIEIGGIRCKIHVGYRSEGNRMPAGWYSWIRVHTLCPNPRHPWNCIPSGPGLPRWYCSDQCHHQCKEEAFACAEGRIKSGIITLRKYLEDTRLAWESQDSERQRGNKQRRRVLREEPTCRFCGAPTTEADHILPLCQGGTSDRDNLQGLCRSCHQAKTPLENVGGLYLLQLVLCII